MQTNPQTITDDFAAWAALHAQTARTLPTRAKAFCESN